MAEIKVDNIKFDEAIKVIRNKLVIPSRQWRDLVGPIHAKAFTVAGAAKLAIVNDFYTSITTIIESGGTLNDFRKDFDRIVDDHNWSYNGKRGWRTRTIFQTNKISAFMAGKWEQMWRVRALRPFLQYLTVGDERVRDSHMKWHLKVFRIDHPIWRLIFPPNDWFCRCGARSLSEDDMAEEGLKESKANIPSQYEEVDPDTGTVVVKHEGIGEGWDYNVGIEWLAPEIAFGKQLLDVPADLRKAALTESLNQFEDTFKSVLNKSAYRIAKGKADFTANRIALGYLSNEVVNKLATSQTALTGLSVLTTEQAVAKLLDGNTGLALSTAAKIPAAINSPTAVLINRGLDEVLYALKHNDSYLVVAIEVGNRNGVNEFKNAFITSSIELSFLDYELIYGSIEGAKK